VSIAERTQRVTPELLLELLWPGDVALSPDGSRIALTVSASAT
jgi:hypothetical protein